MFYRPFRVFILAAVGLLVLWLVLDTSRRPEQLISFGGVCMFVVLVFLLSAHRTAVSSGEGHRLHYRMYDRCSDNGC